MLVDNKPLSFAEQIFTLFVLAIPIACIARTVVYEEVFREPREWCMYRSQTCRSLIQRKFFYLFTCEYCFSHYVTLAVLLLVPFKLVASDWRGYVVAFFALVFVANLYLNLYARLRVDITSEKKEIEAKEKQIEKIEAEIAENGRSRSSADPPPGTTHVPSAGTPEES